MDVLIEWFNDSRSALLLRALVVAVLGVLLARFAASSVRRMTDGRLTRQQTMLFSRVVFYGLLGVVVASVLRELGVNLTVFLGAAGIISVAIGFASQTSASNIISGLFLIGEKPFVVGDNIKVGEVTGEVLAIDLMSAKIRTFENLYVRVPNETLIKSNIVNLSKFPIRRLDIQIGVAYHQDIDRVQSVLLDLANRNPLVLVDPAPLIIFQGFGESSVDLQYSVWATRENFLEMRNSIPQDIKHAFDAANIEIPYPRRALVIGAESAPFPVRVVDNDDRAAEAGS